MKYIVATMSVLGCAFGVAAQSAETDSVEVHELQEIVIEAPKVIRKADMDVYQPSKSAVENSRNGLQLLNNLMIPTLAVNDALGTIQAAGQSVQIRINGREATIEQLRTVLPETIKRVEWIDNPGLRYGGANYVLNVIVTNPDAGGALMAMARPALNTAFGNYFADVKLNNGYSQWEVGANFKLTNGISGHRDYTETFTFPDGTSLTRTERPLGGDLSNSQGTAYAEYSYMKPDTTTIVVDLSWQRNFNSRLHYEGLMSLSNGSDDIRLTDIQGDHGSTPSLSLYWEQKFARRQSLVVDFGASLYSGTTYSDYIERLPDASATLTDIRTNIHDRNQTYAIEADYIKKWDNARFTAGASYRANRNRSQYNNLDGEIFHQRQDRVYFFAEYFRRFGKWTATAGMGAQYTDYLFEESDRGSRSWSPRPQATITYSLNQRHNFRLNFTSWQSAPSLAETNVVPQQLDGFQWRVGNPDLKTANSYMLTFRYGFTLPRVSGSFGVRGFTSPNAITPLMMWQGDRLVTTYENSRGLSNVSFFLAPQVEIVRDWLSVSGYLQYRMERMRGTGYVHYNNAWSGNVELQLAHYGFLLSVNYVRAQRDLWGEKISWGEDISNIELSYSLKDWQFAAGMLVPFGRYDQGSRSISALNSNEQHMRAGIERMPYITISYNLQWGRHNRSANKLVDVDASTDRSTAGGR